MAVDTTQSWQEYTADGSTAYFTFDFSYNANRPQDIIVGMRTGDNTYSVVGAEHYQIIPNAAGDGGQVRFIQNPSGSQVIDDPVAAGTIVRISRASLETSDATWQVGLEMADLINLFDRLFRLVQENKGGFDNVIQTFQTQHGISLYEMLAAHDNHLFFWNNTDKTITPTDFPKEDVVRATNGLFFRISTNASGVAYLEWSATGTGNWSGIDITAVSGVADAAMAKANANETAIQNEEMTRANADTALSQAISAEQQARIQQDGLLRQDIDTNAQNISTLQTGKQNALSSAQIAATNSGITAEKVATYDGYQNQIDNNAQAINTEKTRVDTINGLIPANASTTNKLATMDDVVAAAEDNNGLRGDYCTTYGIVGSTGGLITIPSGTNTIKIPVGTTLKTPGSVDSLITISSEVVHTVVAEDTFVLFWTANGTYIEADDVQFIATEPVAYTGDNMQAWWNGTRWQFRAAGGAWQTMNATPLCRCIFVGSSLARLDFVGYRLLDAQDLDTSLFALDADVVHKIGNETIDGEKYFLQDFYVAGTTTSSSLDNKKIRFSNSSGSTTYAWLGSTTAGEFVFGGGSNSIFTIQQAYVGPAQSRANNMDLGRLATRFRNLYMNGFISNGTYTYNLPTQSGTLITSADLSDYAYDKTAMDTIIATLNAKIDVAATSGTIVGQYWFGRTDATSTIPLPTSANQNYYDFTTNTIYTANNDLSGWTASGTYTPPTDEDVRIMITSKFWDITTQAGQQGGEANWSHTTSSWGYFPKIVDFNSPAFTGTPTTPDLTSASPSSQVANKAAIEGLRTDMTNLVNQSTNLQGVATRVDVGSTGSLTFTSANDIYPIRITTGTTDCALSLTFTDDSIAASGKARTYEVHITIQEANALPNITWSVSSSSGVLMWMTDSQKTITEKNAIAIFTFRRQAGIIIANYAGAYSTN